MAQINQGSSEWQALGQMQQTRPGKIRLTFEDIYAAKREASEVHIDTRSRAGWRKRRDERLRLAAVRETEQ